MVNFHNQVFNVFRGFKDKGKKKKKQQKVLFFSFMKTEKPASCR